MEIERHLEAIVRKIDPGNGEISGTTKCAQKK
jgi:hypothetical protein